MTEADRELMQRYIYQVVRRLAKDQREETARELEELITDMAEQKGMEEALKELGDPAVFAGKYREEPAWVIGPEYSEDYRWLLKIVLAALPRRREVPTGLNFAPRFRRAVRLRHTVR